MLKILALVWIHWLADFYLQSDKMALNKSKSNLVLGGHCLAYGLCLVVFGWEFALLNAVAHFFVDGVSSRVTAMLYAAGDRHNFFVVIGLDQAIHLTILLASAKWLGVL